TRCYRDWSSDVCSSNLLKRTFSPGPFDLDSALKCNAPIVVTKTRKMYAKPFAHWTLWIALLSSIAIISFSEANSFLTGHPTTNSDIPIPRVEFVDLAAKAGLTGRHVTGSDQSKEYILESTGSGVALIDFNSDGFLDIFLVNGTTLEGFPKGQEPTNHLYQTNGDGTFKDVTEKTNLIQTGRGQGACVAGF